MSLATVRMQSGKRIAARGFAVLLAAMFLCAGAWAHRRKFLPSHPINLNSATRDQLEELPDVGPAMARSILKFRRVSGPFERASDLLAIPGISRRRFDRIRPYVFVGREKGQASRGRPRGKRPSEKSRKQTGRG